MPGGEQAIREPWRMAAAHLLDAGLGLSALAPAVERPKLRTVEQMLDKKLNTPATSSMGRLFDAVSALIGLRHVVRYEGQAAVELEWLATDVDDDDAYPFAWEQPTSKSGALVIDTRPLIRAIADDVAKRVNPRRMARKFHTSVAGIVLAVCRLLRAETRMNLIALSGGVFLNVLLSRDVRNLLEQDGFQVYAHERVPAGDGGLCLGQIAIAARQLARPSSASQTAVGDL
jgi:hydrogenase maturation protein HypF